MPHAHTARLLDAWARGRPADRPAPARTALSPLLSGALAPQMFVLAEVEGEWRFRTAGALLEDLHGRALAGSRFVDVWTPADRARAAAALDGARGRGGPRVLSCRGETARGGTAALELTLAPATGPSGAQDRCVGLYQPLSPLARLDGHVLAALHLEPPAAPRLVVDNTRAPGLGSRGADVAER